MWERWPCSRYPAHILLRRSCSTHPSPVLRHNGYFREPRMSSDLGTRLRCLKLPSHRRRAGLLVAEARSYCCKRIAASKSAGTCSNQAASALSRKLPRRRHRITRLVEPLFFLRHALFIILVHVRLFLTRLSALPPRHLSVALLEVYTLPNQNGIPSGCHQQASAWKGSRPRPTFIGLPVI